MESTLIATCGTSINGIHNILFSHYLKKNHKFDNIILLLTESLLGQFFDDLTDRLNKTNSEMDWKLPLPEKRKIPGENLNEIKNAIQKILDEHESFILDITAGRKIMAVGAAMAFESAKANNKVIAYYLLKGETVAPTTDRLIQHLFQDEWDLQYYS